MARTIFDAVSNIQARKEREGRVPPYATLAEMKRELEGVEDGEMYAMLDAELLNGMVIRRRTINGYSFQIAEE